MLSRRTFLSTSAAATAAACVTRSGFAAAPLDPTPSGNARHVNIAIGTGGHGHTFPGATMPFGMVQLSPDTGIHDWDHCSGYHYADSSILGFSHTHLSGTGCIDLLDFLLMPATDDFHFDPAALPDTAGSYRSKFSHADEVTAPGYYRVLLQDSRVQAELTATERAGFHRYTFPQSDKAVFLLDLTHGGDTSKTLDQIRWTSLRVIGNDTLIGGRQTDCWAKGRLIYFTMKFSKPFDSIEVFAAGQPVADLTHEVKDKNLRAVLHFKTHANEVVLVKTGISGVSSEGAGNNLAAEIPGWDFDRTRKVAAAAWEQQLSRVDIPSGDPKYLQIYYTGLYHMMVAPNLFDDTDGQYRGMDGQVHTLPAGAHNYSTFSLWDTYRALHPMYTLILAERVPDLVNCLVRMADQSPQGVPVWPLHASETGCMVGYHSAPVVGEALAKGFPGIDAQAAYRPFRERAEIDDYRGLPSYRKLGYVACDLQDESASKTLDYAYDDRAVSAIAKAAGEQADADMLLKRSDNFKNLYDQQSGFIRPRYADGHWATPFDPIEIKDTKWRDYTEANAWQTTFCVQHNPALLIQLIGGNDAFVKKLDTLFTMSSAMPADMPPDVSGLVGQYAHGNEPCHHMAYLYNYAGAPHKTQSRIRMLLETEYNNQPDGMAGNEDCGQMSAWFAMSALGIYPVDPVSAKYDFGTPLFDKVTLTVGSGKKLVIEAKRESPKSIYLRHITFNQRPVYGLTIDHATLTQGGTLTFDLVDNPPARI